jgi:hypothetical protein
MCGSSMVLLFCASTFFCFPLQRCMCNATTSCVQDLRWGDDERDVSGPFRDSRGDW